MVNATNMQPNRYKVLKDIGEGSYGITYLAEDNLSGKKVVLKILRPQFMESDRYNVIVNRFRKEAQRLSSISHPNVVKVIEFLQQEEASILVMEFVEGETLDERIKKSNKPLSENEAIAYFQKLSNALHTVHDQGIIHCDLHPRNIIIRNDNEPILIDFGSAKEFKAVQNTTRMTYNSFTPYEQNLEKVPPHPKNDIYALAAILYFAVTGKDPIDAIARSNGVKLIPPIKIRADLSTWLNKSILYGMAFNAKNRPKSIKIWGNLLYSPHEKRSYLWLNLVYLASGFFPLGILTGISFSNNFIKIISVYSILMILLWIFSLTLSLYFSNKRINIKIGIFAILNGFISSIALYLFLCWFQSIWISNFASKDAYTGPGICVFLYALTFSGIFLLNERKKKIEVILGFLVLIFSIAGALSNNFYFSVLWARFFALLGTSVLAFRSLDIKSYFLFNLLGSLVCGILLNKFVIIIGFYDLFSGVIIGYLAFMHSYLNVKYLNNFDFIINRTFSLREFLFVYALLSIISFLIGESAAIHIYHFVRLFL